MNSLSNRERRALAALIAGPVLREALDKAAGCSNGPELVAGLRRKGLSIICQRVTRIDRDGKPSRPGVYSLPEPDKQTAIGWLGA